jgi:hypothetical protein
MIGKQIKGTSFRGVLNYLHAKEGTRLIGGNMAGKNPRTLAAEFRLGRELNPKLKRAVYHASLSLPKTESLDDERWRAIASDYLRGMGFEGSQYVIYRHSDRSHDHIHLVACRIRVTDGSTVSDSWDYRRSEELIRSLEKQYQLEAVPSSRERETRAPTTGEWRRQERTSQVGVRTRLQTLIDQATQNCPTMPQFIHRLKEQGVDVRVGYTRSGQVKGISYSLDGIAFSGTHLGKAYTFPGLQKYRGVSYQLSQDEEIRSDNALEPVNPSIAPETLSSSVSFLNASDRKDSKLQSQTDSDFSVLSPHQLEEVQPSLLLSTDTVKVSSPAPPPLPIHLSQDEVFKMLRTAQEALSRYGRGSKNEKTFNNPDYQIQQVASFKTYGWEHCFTITALDGRGKVLEMKGKSPQPLKIVENRLDRQDVSPFEELQQALDYFQQVRQLKQDAEIILWQYGVRDNSLKSYGTFEGQKYRIIADEQAFRIIALDGRGEILNYPDDPYTPHAEVKAKANFTTEDVDLFRTVASQIAQQREKAFQQRSLQRSPERELER